MTNITTVKIDKIVIDRDLLLHNTNESPSVWSLIEDGLTEPIEVIYDEEKDVYYPINNTVISAIKHIYSRNGNIKNLNFGEVEVQYTQKVSDFKDKDHLMMFAFLKQMEQNKDKFIGVELVVAESYGDYELYTEFYRCLSCGGSYIIDDFNYCPHCGGKIVKLD